MREEIFTRYYANGGSEFNTKDECEAYEKNTDVNLEEVLPDKKTSKAKMGGVMT